MTDSQALILQLQNSVQHELALTEQFLAVLQEEATVLESGQPNDLTRTTGSKESLASQLHGQVQKRQTLLGQLQLPDSLEGLKSAAALHPAMAAPIAQLENIAEQARHLNEQNGVTINTLLTSTQQMISTLQTLTGGAAVYDANGRKKGAQTPQSVPRLKPLKAG